MLVSVSKKIAACYERASVCRANAERQSDPELKKAFLRIEESWLNVARRFERSEQLDRSLSAAQQAAGSLVFRCPETGGEINPGLEAGYDSISGAPVRTVRVDCEHCGRQHPIAVPERKTRNATSYRG
jgi:hypothetical protein